MLFAICLSREETIHPMTMLLHLFHALSFMSPSCGLCNEPSIKLILILATKPIMMDLFQSLYNIPLNTTKTSFVLGNLKGVNITHCLDFAFDR